MAAKQEHPSLADYVAIAISPALIIAMITSLVYFLLAVVYRGQFESRLHWILFWFVLATVLIARISMDKLIAERSALYGLALAVVTFIAIQSFVEYPEESPLAPFNWAITLALMALIWWCAHKLTWDCTFIDEDAQASGEGLLDAAGLEPNAAAPVVEVDAASASEKSRRAEIGGSGVLGWWDRYRQYKADQSKKPHAPGVWVIYFSLAALPLFGLGQSLIPVEAKSRRQYAFWLLTLYVASGLGLLLTTSFLGLRRYLRQRKLRMPAAMTGVWLLMGAAMILVLLVLGSILPRPNAEYPLIKFKPLGGPKDKTASRYAMKGGGTGKGQGQAKQSEQSAEGRKTPGSRNSGGSGERKNQGGQDSSKNEQSGKSQDQAGSESGQDKQSESNKSDKGNQQKGSESNQGDERAKDADKDKKNQDGSADNSQKDKEQRGGDRKADRGDERESTDKSEKKGGGQQDQQKGEEKDSESEDSNSTPPETRTTSSWFSFMDWLLPIVKWIVFGLVALVVALILFRSIVKFLANFTNWAKGLLAALEGIWNALFGWWWRAPKPAREIDEEEIKQLYLRPFSSYQNPFWDGSDASRSPEEIVRYSFEALEAWSREHDVPRREGETPLEFGMRLGDETPAMEKEVRQLAALYARAAYARGKLPVSSLEVVKKFWQRIIAVEDAPLSA